MYIASVPQVTNPGVLQELLCSVHRLFAAIYWTKRGGPAALLMESGQFSCAVAAGPFAGRVLVVYIYLEIPACRSAMEASPRKVVLSEKDIRGSIVRASLCTKALQIFLAGARRDGLSLQCEVQSVLDIRRISRGCRMGVPPMAAHCDILC